MGLFDKFKLGLGKSSSDLSEGFKNIFSKKVIDDNVLNEFEELIISSDAGIDVAKELRKDFENFKIDKKLDNHQEILKLIAEKMAINLLKYEKDLSLMGNANSSVIVVSGVAVEIGKKNNFNSIILESPFTSIEASAKIYYPYLPVKLLLKDRYDSISKIKMINNPILIMHGKKDDVVPFSMGKELFEKANRPKHSYFTSDDDHMMEFNTSLLEKIKEFIEKY